MAPDTASGVDPELRANGSNAGRDSLSILAGVARHLAAIPGHKNLVWVTNDSALADWTDKAAGGDKNSKQIGGYALRAQEALNDAHVSIYPLDVSRLEATDVDASLANPNVELSPSAPAPPQAQAEGAAPGRISAQMQQDLHPVQAAFEQMADATGGRAFGRSDGIASSLDKVVSDGRAEYLIGFTPDTPADNQYHLLTVKIAGRRGITLRCRTGYQYATEPTGLKDRFRQAVWQSRDMNEIAVSANPEPASEGIALKLSIAANDLALKQQENHWIDKLDIFLIQSDDEGLHARVAEQTLSLSLMPSSYARVQQEGIPFEQFIEKKQDSGSVRIVVVDENSGRMGSVTVPLAALKGKS